MIDEMGGSVKDAICWDGTHAEVLLYALFQEHNTEEAFFEIDGYTPIKPVRPYPLIDEFGYLNNSRLNLYAVELTEFPRKFENYLAVCFNRLADLGASAYWAMFDGVFHYEHLLTTDVSSQIYGFGLNGQSSHIAVQDNIIMGVAWAKKIQGFKDSLVEMKLINLSPGATNI